MATPAPKRYRKRLIRFEHSHHLRLLTFSCFRRQQFFRNEKIMDLFAAHLAAAREAMRFHLYAWVVMPEHIHLFIWPLIPEWPASIVLRELKRPFAEEVIARWTLLKAPILSKIKTRGGLNRFWQHGGGHDSNIYTSKGISNAIAYVNLNPVRRGLVKNAEDYRWSSAGAYAGVPHPVVKLDPLPPRRPQ